MISRYIYSNEYVAPNPINNRNRNSHSVFLAGSIEMGKAEDWQQKVISAFITIDNVNFFNPRRADWDPTWEQTSKNINFAQQVNWEMDSLEVADVIFLYLILKLYHQFHYLNLGIS